MANFDPQISKTVQPILTKHETYNYLPKTTRHARPHIAVSTWVVWANTQFATVSFFPCLFFFFFFCLIPSARAQVAPVDRPGPKLACKCGFGQGCAFWGSRWWPITFRGSDPQNPKFWGRISSQICKKIQIVMSSKLCIGLAYNLTGRCGPMKRLRGWSYMMM